MSHRSNAVIHEADLTHPILKLLSQEPSGFVETTKLIKMLDDIFKPTGKDAEILEGRQDTHFSQKVRNVISHRNSSTNPIGKGWITYCEERHGVQITALGRQALASTG